VSPNKKKPGHFGKEPGMGFNIGMLRNFIGSLSRETVFSPPDVGYSGRHFAVANILPNFTRCMGRHAFIKIGSTHETNHFDRLSGDL